jgi:TPR repeat protein
MEKEMLLKAALSFLVCLLSSCLLIFCLSGCSGKTEDKGKEVVKTPGDSYSLSTEDMKKLSDKAEAGDADAGFRLWQYYAFYAGNSEKALYWEKKAAEHGHVTAQYNLGMRFLVDPVLKDKNQALYWLGKAAEYGDIDAKKKLEELRKEK